MTHYTSMVRLVEPIMGVLLNPCHDRFGQFPKRQYDL